MTEFDYVIIVGCASDELKARTELIKSVVSFQKLGFEATGNFFIGKKGFIFKLYYCYQPMVKRAKISGVNC